jgi:hypothetical protein
MFTTVFAITLRKKKTIIRKNFRTEWEEEEGGRVRAQYSVEPSPGSHLLRWRGAWIRLERVREQQQVDVIGKNQRRSV